jgi:hypothetical protein
MSGIARFHDKLHRSNHHTAATPGLPDSSYDPIASPEKPFRGDFILSGSLSSRNEVKSSSFETSSAKITNRLVLSGASGGVLANSNANNALASIPTSLSINYDGGVYLKNNLTLTNNGVISAKLPGGTIHTDNLTPAYTIVKDNSAGWNTAALWAGTPTTPSDITVNGDLTVNENLLVLGNLTALGPTTLINVTATTTDALCVFNADPTRPALDITQVTGTKPGVVLKHLGTGNILSAVGSVGGTNFVISSAGYVGIGTSNPRAELQILSGLLALDGIKEAPPLFSNVTLPTSSISGAYIYFGNLGDEYGTTKLPNDWAMFRQIGEDTDKYHLTLDLYNNILGTVGQKFSIRNNSPNNSPVPLFHINEYGNIGINSDQPANTAQLYIDATSTTKSCIAVFGRRSPFVFYHYSTAAGDNAYSVSKYYSASGTGTNPVCALAGAGHSFRIIPYVQGTNSLGAITGEWANDDGTGAADITMGYEARPTISDLRGYISFSTADGSAEGGSNPCEERLRITSDGKVGVGTSLPGKELTVLGDISATGDMVVDGFHVLKQGSFVNSLTELYALTAGNRKYLQSEIYDTWLRYSHSSSTISDTANISELNGWFLNPINGIEFITNNLNSGTALGLVSQGKYNKYIHEARFFSLNNDDDTNGMVIAKASDKYGNSHTLSLIRSPGNGQASIYECIKAEPAATFNSAPNTLKQANAIGINTDLSARGLVVGDRFYGNNNVASFNGELPYVNTGASASSNEYAHILAFNKSLSNNFKLVQFNEYFRPPGSADEPTNNYGATAPRVVWPALCSFDASIKADGVSQREANEPLNINDTHSCTPLSTTAPNFCIVYNYLHKTNEYYTDPLLGTSKNSSIYVSYNIKNINTYSHGWADSCSVRTASGDADFYAPSKNMGDISACGGVAVKVVRDTNKIICYTSNFYKTKTELNNIYELAGMSPSPFWVASVSCDLGDHDFLEVFRDKQANYGYLNESQRHSYFETLKFIDTFDVRFGNDTYTYDLISEEWTKKAIVTYTSTSNFTLGKFSRDHYNANTYYVYGANEMLPVAKWYSSINEDQRTQKVSIDNELTLVTTTTSHPVSSFTITPSAVATIPSGADIDYLVCYVNGKKRYIPLYA